MNVAIWRKKLYLIRRSSSTYFHTLIYFFAPFQGHGQKSGCKYLHNKIIIILAIDVMCVGVGVGVLSPFLVDWLVLFLYSNNRHLLHIQSIGHIYSSNDSIYGIFLKEMWSKNRAFNAQCSFFRETIFTKNFVKVISQKISRNWFWFFPLSRFPLVVKIYTKSSNFKKSAKKVLCFEFL